MKLSDREWKDFAVPYVFQNIQRGKRLKKADHISGIVPYVSSTANNNGVDAYIEATKGTRVFENCISLANSGSVGTAFYEPFAFVASDHVTSLKRENTSQYVYLFLTAVLEQQKSNFDFNREINDLRVKKMRIMLPVDDNDEPDYQFMEDYMKELMVAKRKQYQEYVEQRLAELGIDAKNTKVGGITLIWNRGIIDLLDLVICLQLIRVFICQNGILYLVKIHLLQLRQVIMEYLILSEMKHCLLLGKSQWKK